MKICKFCGTENENRATACSSCGGNEFKYKCDNCGTIYDDGKYCPKCGVKEGKKAKKCPICGAEYYSAACPDCGYTPQKEQSSPAYNVNIPAEKIQPAKKRKTWLWVLGWIFCFPIPLTILIWKNEKLDKKLRYGIIAAMWAPFLLIGIFGEPSDSKNNETISPKTPSAVEQEIAVSDVNENLYYEHDEIVNYFITEYNEKESVPIKSISQGNIKTKAYGYIGETRIEMLNSYEAYSESFNVTVYGGNSEEETEAMFATFKKIAKILDPALTSEEIDDAVISWKNGGVMVENEKIGELTITYIPFIELSEGYTNSRIDIATSNYAK